MQNVPPLFFARAGGGAIVNFYPLHYLALALVHLLAQYDVIFIALKVN